jgi:opacity protein-like surface antigen
MRRKYSPAEASAAGQQVGVFGRSAAPIPLIFLASQFGPENATFRGEEFMEMRSTKLLIFVLGGALAAFGQEEYSKQEVSVQAIGSFVKSTTDHGVEQKATDTGGVLASYRYFFNLHNGVEVSYAWTNPTQNYLSTSGTIGVPSNSNEALAAYVYRMPLKRFTPFVLAGTGALIFSARDDAAGSTQARAAFVYGGGADFKVSSHVFLRAEYRGLVYNSPTFALSALDGTDRITHRAEPSVGIGYRF